MHTRVLAMRKALAKKLSWDFMDRQKGLFSFSGLKTKQVESLIQDSALYMTRDGRMNISGLTEKNIDYVANAIKNVL